MKTYSDITQTIGNTPLVELKNLSRNLFGKVYLKLEFFNPLGSVKDRIGRSMIEDAESKGVLKKGMEVIEPTSGNTGIALAFVCASKGYSLTLTMPETMSVERRTLLLLLGAKIVLTPGPLGMKGAVAKALELKDLNSNSFMPSQFDNPSNPEIHKKTTALEIWNDLDGKIDVFVAGVGTAGTISGVGEVLKSKNSQIKVIAVEPEESPVLSGGSPAPHKIQGIGAGFIPKNYNPSVVDEIQTVSSQESLLMAKKIIKTEGIPVGISSGAAIAVALREAAKESSRGKNIVAIVASYSERYLSTLLAEEERQEALKLEVSQPKEEYLKKVTS